MKLNQLRDFIAVARAGSIHQAARELRLSQPALTKSIRQLEKTVGGPLFERTSKGAVLNALGRAFLARAELAVNELSRGKDELRQLIHGEGGRVALAVSGTPFMLFLPKALAAFRHRYPTARVRIVEGLLPVMLPELRDGRLDFAMAPKPASPLGKDFAVIPVFFNRLAVMGRRNHPLRNARSLAQLTGADWILTNVIGAEADELEAPFRARGLPAPNAPVQCESLIGVVSLLANSDLLAFLPEQWLQAPIAARFLAMLPVAENIAAPEICLIRRAGLPLTPVAEAFADALMREAKHVQPKVRRVSLTPN